MRALVVVDAANVVGSVPDGWWRDRAAATTRLRDRLAAAAGDVLPAVRGDMLDGAADDPEVVLVVEGKARGVQGVAGVRVVPAPGSGDDAIVALLAEQEVGRARWLVTADRGLRDRAEALGVHVVGPRALRLPPSLPPSPPTSLPPIG